MQLESSVTLFDDTKVETRFAELQITADGITSEVSKKVGNDEIISRINQSAEAVTINANKVNIEGAAIFSSGRLSQSSLDGAYDASGSATGAVDNLKSDLSSGSGTTVINGGHITTGTIDASRANITNINASNIETGTLDADRIGAGSLEIGKLNSSAQATINSAGTKATNYITDIGNDGIRVHDAHTSNNSAVINSDGMEVFKGGTSDAYSVAKYGDTTRVGKNGSYHTILDGGSFVVAKGDAQLFSVNATGQTRTTKTTVKTIPGIYNATGGMSDTTVVELVSGVSYTFTQEDRTTLSKTVTVTASTSSFTISSSAQYTTVTCSFASAGSNKVKCTIVRREKTGSTSGSSRLTPVKITRTETISLPAISFMGDNKLLAYSSAGEFMTENQTWTLAEPISEQLNGICLVWYPYEPGEQLDKDYQFTFIPKSMITLGNTGSGKYYSSGMLCNATFSKVGSKVLEMTDTTIKGTSFNTGGGTRNGITYDNTDWVLRYVFGV